MSRVLLHQRQPKVHVRIATNQDLEEVAKLVVTTSAGYDGLVERAISEVREWHRSLFYVLCVAHDQRGNTVGYLVFRFEALLPRICPAVELHKIEVTEWARRQSIHLALVKESYRLLCQVIQVENARFDLACKAFDTFVWVESSSHLSEVMTSFFGQHSGQGSRVIHGPFDGVRKVQYQLATTIEIPSFLMLSEKAA